jgi:hypothetical protein
MRRLGARRERVGHVIAVDAVPGAGEVERRHAVVLRGRNGKELLSLLVLCRSSEVVVQLVEMGARDAGEFRARESRLGPRDARWAGLERRDVVGSEALLSQCGGDAGILEDAVENGSGCSADLIRHARDRSSSVARLACNEGATEQEHEQKTRSDGLVLFLLARDDGHVMVLILGGWRLLVGGEVVDEDVVVPVVAAHVEVVHFRGEVGVGGAGGDGHAVASRVLKTLSEDGDLLAELSGLERVVADKLFLVELQLVHHVGHLHGLAMPVLLLEEEGLVVDAHLGKVLFHAAHLLDPLLLLVLELFSVLLLPLPGVKSATMLAREQGEEHIPNGERDQIRNAEPRTKRGLHTRPVCCGEVVFAASAP